MRNEAELHNIFGMGKEGGGQAGKWAQTAGQAQVNPCCKIKKIFRQLLGKKIASGLDCRS